MQIGVRFDAVHFCSFDQRANDRPSGASPIAACEQMISCRGPQDGLRAQPDWYRVQCGRHEKTESNLPIARARNGSLRRAYCGQRCEEVVFRAKSGMHRRSASIALSCRKTIRRLLASNCGFDRIKFADPAQGFLGKRRIGRLRDLIELAPRMRPARSKDDIALDGQPLEAGVAVDVENALEVLKMRHRALGLSVRREQIDSRRRLRSRPWSLLACIDPQASGLRAPAARIEHRDGRVISKEMIGGKDVLAQPSVQSFEPPAGAADPARECRAFDLDAMPGKICDCR